MQQGLWALFWATGLPEAWLVMRIDPEGERGEGETPIPTDRPPGEKFE